MILIAALVAVVAAVARGPFMMAERTLRASSDPTDQGRVFQGPGSFLAYMAVERGIRLGSAGLIAWELAGDQWLLGGLIFGVIAFWAMPLVSSIVAARLWKAMASESGN